MHFKGKQCTVIHTVVLLCLYLLNKQSTLAATQQRSNNNEHALYFVYGIHHTHYTYAKNKYEVK